MIASCVKTLIVVVIALNTLCKCSPHSNFHHFEILKSHHLSIRQKRSTTNESPQRITATFTAFKQHFMLDLVAGSNVLHSDIEVKLVTKNGSWTPHRIQNIKFYTGHLADDRNEYVHASEQNGSWFIHIHRHQEFYSVEPLHLYDSRASPRDMIVYRTIDIKDDNNTGNVPFCRVGYPSDNSATRDSIYDKLNSGSRQEKYNWPKGGTNKKNFNVQSETGEDGEYKATRMMRAAEPKLDRDAKRGTQCLLLAIVTYDLFKGAGRSNPNIIIQMLVASFDYSNHIFRNTTFGETYTTGYGVVLYNIILNTEYADTENHYNSNNPSMTAQEAIERVGELENLDFYCLVYISTQHNWGDNLGYATIADHNGDPWTGGICAKFRHKYRHIATSTVLRKDGTVMPMKLYNHVVAHELGHSFGAHHDPIDGDETCNPSASNGGKYLMWHVAGLVKGPNSNKFSPCSKGEIHRVLADRAYLCLLGETLVEAKCGDGKRNVGSHEQCDPGHLTVGQMDPCCKSDCGYVHECSYMFDVCCGRDCIAAANTQLCYPKGTTAISPCYNPGNCTGTSFWECPEPTPKPNGTPCGIDGKCNHGRCQPYCELLGLSQKPIKDLRPCDCEQNTTAMCKQCCKDVGRLEQQCEIMGKDLPNGTPCLIGTCYRGKCQRDHSSDTLASSRSPDALLAARIDLTLNFFCCAYTLFLNTVL